MCTINRLSKAEVEEFKKESPEEFTVYRCIWMNQPLFWCQKSREPNTTVPGIHIAGRWLGNRMPVTYEPGFHVFKMKKVAMRYAGHDWGFVRVVPVTIYKSWVKEVGETNNGLEGVLVCSHIKVEINNGC